MLKVDTLVTNSKICEGVGLFAKVSIPIGTVIWEYDKNVDWTLDIEAFNNLKVKYPRWFKKNYYYFYYDRHVKGYIYCKDNGRFINHSNAPNVYVDPLTGNDLTNRDITVGEELLINYYTMTNNEFIKKYYVGI